MSDQVNVKEEKAADSVKDSGVAAQKPKTFVERFQEIEDMVNQLKQVFEFHNQILQTFVKEIAALREGTVSIREVVNAMLKLADEDKVLNTLNTATKITETKAEAFKKHLEDSVKNGTMKVVDEVSKLDHIVSFSTEDILFGFSKILEFTDEKIKESLMKAKAGDVVEGLKILNVYEEVTQEDLVKESVPVETSETETSN